MWSLVCFISGGRGKGRRSGPSLVPLLLWRNGDLTLEQRHLSRSGSRESKLFGEILITIGIFTQALQTTIDSIGTLKMWYSDEVGPNFRGQRKWTLLYLCVVTLACGSSGNLLVSMEPLLEIGRSDGTSRISKVGIFDEDKRTQDNSEHQSRNNPNTQGDGWLDFFLFKRFSQ